MSTFLDRLKKKQVIPGGSDAAPTPGTTATVQPATPAAPTESNASAEQLRVDIYKSPSAIIIYAQIGGAKVDTYDVLIEGDNDVVTITGQRVRPNGEHFQKFTTDDKEKILEECSWGKFYRQIILPAEVDPTKTEAVMSDGVLVVMLPLKEYRSTGVRIHVNKV